MPVFNRRNFLKASGLTVLPALLPTAPLWAAGGLKSDRPAADPIIRFFNDGDDLSPSQYIMELQKIDSKAPIRRDFYGQGGAVADLEKKFEEITGKEKSIYMPTGTMANQLAIAVLSGQNTKIFVQDTSHIYRDEADAAQSVFQKRLMPLAKGETYFTADALKQAIESLKEQEVFASGVGAVAIENPVRRRDGRMVPLEEIRKISAYCRTNKIGLHLDGARLYMAAAWSGVSVKEYSSYFDTVYISLYKYFGAGSGAILCGTKEVIGKMPHLIKIHGGTTFSSWYNAAIVLSKLENFSENLANARQRSVEVFAALNQLPGIRITAIDEGTNIYNIEAGMEIDGKKLQETLHKQYNIRLQYFNDKNRSQLTVNETLLYRDTAYVVDAFRNAIRLSGK